jgi:glyoxylase-like metal-dependent hydrolase (beta-lactamase superfamily II)/8-oxo-dGTP pyrophosphatase MutT (NUDIX family)
MSTESPAQGTTEGPVAPRAAATVMLLRDTDRGPEVFLQRRVKAMKFAPSVSVFPGGGVDVDRDSAIGASHWTGPEPSWWAERFGCPPELATALVCAAVRETFEECGVLLAAPVGAPSSGVPRLRADLLTAGREQLVRDRAALPDILTGNGWVLRADLLRAWSNWITPEAEPRRYDTRFFVAELPEGQQADARTTEVTEARWWRPADALDAWRSGDIQLLPPTWVSLEQIAELPDVAAVLRAADERPITPLIPKVRREGEKILLSLPGELGYDNAPLSLSPRQAPVQLRERTGGLLPERTEHPVYDKIRAVTASASVILAENPSPMTLEGTNTWLLRAPDAESVIVIDPGPLDEGHLRLVSEQGPVAQILLTHRHHDHAEGAARLAELTRAPVRALDPSLVLGGEGLAEGDVVAAAGLELRVVATPGHTSDSLCFLLPDAVLTGDTILGRGTTVIDHPDGTLADYLGSLRRLAELSDGLAVLPGHGPELADAGTVARQYLAHRAERLDQVRAALRTLDRPADQVTPRQIVEIVYADVDQVLWPAAEWSVQAQLTYLTTHPA